MPKKTQPTSRRLVSQWVRANAPVVEANLLQGYDNAAHKGTNCTFAISRELTKREEPVLLSCYGGELFAFTLTQRQAKSFQAVKRTMQCVEIGRRLEFPPGTPALFDVGDLQFDDADGQATNEEFHGRLYYVKREGVDYPGTIRLAMEFSLGGRRRMANFYYPPAGLLPEGAIEFTFNAVEKALPPAERGKYAGPIVAHVRLLGTMDAKSPSGCDVPLSNTCAAIIELI